LDHLRILSIAFAVAVVASAIAPVADAAPPEGKGKPDRSSVDTGADAQALIRPDVDYDEVRAIAVAEHHTGYKPLPRGIAKNLARGKPLPPGIAKKAVPATVLHHLPTYPDYEWRRCGTDLVLVQIATQLVAEVVANIFK
jgi:Ni/Co efflux regulator RcnB